MIDLEYEGRSYSNLQPEDCEEMGVPVAVYQKALIARAWFLIRQERDTRLRASDYAVMPDYPLTDAQKAEVTAYRQALRDIPETVDSPDAVEWPTKPEVLTQ